MGSIEAGGDLDQVTFRHRISPLAERNPACVRQRGPDFFVRPLRVMSRRHVTPASRPLFPSKRTFVSVVRSPLMCHKRTSRVAGPFNKGAGSRIGTRPCVLRGGILGHRVWSSHPET